MNELAERQDGRILLGLTLNSILENPNAPEEAILQIAADNRLPLRLAALRHPSFSGDALYQMLSHPEQGVAYLAKRRVFTLFPW